MSLVDLTLGSEDQRPERVLAEGLQSIDVLM